MVMTSEVEKIQAQIKQLQTQLHQIETRQAQLYEPHMYEKQPQIPGIYRWWVNEEGLKRLNISTERLHMCEMKNKMYALYTGKATNLKHRLRWHIKDTHTARAIHTGCMSTLRQTLHALLDIPQNELEGQREVITFLNSYMKFEILEQWDINTIEKKHIADVYTPLNASNKTEFGKILKKARRLNREKSAN